MTKATVDIGLSRTIGTKWKKTGATPNGETLNKIADYFGVTTDYLLGGEQKETPTNTEGVKDEDLMFALFGTHDEITEDMLEDVKAYARFKFEQQRKGK